MTPAVSKRAWWRSAGLRIAVVTGVLSLLAASVGSYVGGRTANKGAKEIQEDAAQRRYARDTAAARASARLLAAELQAMDGYARRSLEEKRFEYAGLEIAVEMPRDDRRLLAARLHARDWDAVATALRAATFIERRARQLGVVGVLVPGQERAMRRRIVRQSRDPNVRLTVEVFLIDLRDQHRAIVEGIAALRRLAEGA
jgi:hypothetical protein